MPEPALQVAVIDDNQDAARRAGPWDSLDGRAEVTFFTDHIADPDALAARLAPFGAVVATPPRSDLGRGTWNQTSGPG